MFDKEFYPTPPEVVEVMLQGIDFTNTSVLEPSAGKGNIIDALKDRGAKVFAYEKNDELRDLVSRKCSILGADFLESTAEDISHCGYIIMNPPFSNAAEHILHAYEKAAEGCEIVALCNSNTMRNSYGRKGELNNLVHSVGEEVDLGEAFKGSERSTIVEVSLVRLWKPVIHGTSDFSGFFMDEEPEGEEAGIMPYNAIREIVQRYLGAIDTYDKLATINEEFKTNLGPLNIDVYVSHKVGYGDKTSLNRSDFARDLQRSCWSEVFNKTKSHKYITAGVKKDLNVFIMNQQKYPFTMRNIYKMLEILSGTRGQVMDKALIEAFEGITKHYDDNRLNIEGWKTNESYLVGRKFILPYMIEQGYSGQFTTNSYSDTTKVDDLQKGLAYLQGEEAEISLYRRVQNQNSLGEIGFGKWFNWGYFRCKGFKKGTLHCEFLDPKVHEMFNRRIAEIQGYPLPEKTRGAKKEESRSKRKTRRTEL